MAYENTKADFYGKYINRQNILASKIQLFKEDDKMSLATRIQDIERIEGISPETRDRALTEVIDHYRMVLLPAHMKALRGTDYKRPLEPAIEKVVAGETTYKAEFERLGAVNFLLYGNLEITGGNFEMEEQIAVVDRAIERLYGPRRPVPRILAPEEAAKSRGRSALSSIHLDLQALSGQRRQGKCPLPDLGPDLDALSGRNKIKK